MCDNRIGQAYVGIVIYYKYYAVKSLLRSMSRAYIHLTRVY